MGASRPKGRPPAGASRGERAPRHIDAPPGGWIVLVARTLREQAVRVTRATAIGSPIGTRLAFHASVSNRRFRRSHARQLFVGPWPRRSSVRLSSSLRSPPLPLPPPPRFPARSSSTADRSAARSPSASRSSLRVPSSSISRIAAGASRWPDTLPQVVFVERGHGRYGKPRIVVRPARLPAGDALLLRGPVFLPDSRRPQLSLGRVFPAGDGLGAGRAVLPPGGRRVRTAAGTPAATTGIRPTGMSTSMTARTATAATGTSNRGREAPSTAPQRGVQYRCRTRGRVSANSAEARPLGVRDRSVTAPVAIPRVSD